MENEDILSQCKKFVSKFKFEYIPLNLNKTIRYDYVYSKSCYEECVKDFELLKRDPNIKSIQHQAIYDFLYGLIYTISVELKEGIAVLPSGTYLEELYNKQHIPTVNITEFKTFTPPQYRKQNKMKQWYLTFGQAHPLKDYYVIVEASSYENARNAVFEILGSKWCMLYDNPPHPKYYPYGAWKEIIEGD